ncbi:type II toxin-antitoxin system VapC family toxin [Allocoleopsis sp.]|uniref:type II toxin-antitoxin system VapC family toxin n=1 Tax=Allocoleopsis sp. TaxID=3088169 RepID=UPI002FD2EAB9
MTDYFLDSSALVKRYINETGSTWVNSLFNPALDNEAFIAAITPVEIVAAITRRARGGTLTLTDATAACNFFRSDLLSSYQVVELTDGLISRAMTLAEGHGLRGYDAVQLAAAFEVHALCVANGLPVLTFVCADIELNAVATHEGLAVENPNNHP